MQRLFFTSAFLMLLIVMDSSMSAPSSDSLMLVHDGRPLATILISEEPSGAVQLAACELQHYIRKISGATVPIVRNPTEVRGTVILVGASKATEELGFRNEDFKQREHLLETRPGTPRALILMGRDAPQGGELDYEGDLTALTSLPYEPLGSCHAVHRFLEEFLGVRWYLPTEIEEVVPERKSIAVGPIKVRRILRSSALLLRGSLPVSMRRRRPA